MRTHADPVRFSVRGRRWMAVTALTVVSACLDFEAAEKAFCDKSPEKCGLTPGLDEDADGFEATSHGGPDCDDSNPQVFPGRTEICGNLIDDDCDSRADCAQPSCQLSECSRPNACALGARCVGGLCIAQQVADCTPPSECLVWDAGCTASGACVFTALPQGTPCSAGECRFDAGCGVSETGDLCLNAADDDEDGRADCEDPSCDGSECNDDDACTSGTACAAGTCSGGARVDCEALPCTAAIPACDSVAGCAYEFVPEGTRCTGGFCTAAAQCEPPFPYTPSNFDPLAYGPSERGGPYALNCATTFDSTDGGFANWCSGSPPPVFLIAQDGGPEAYVIVMSGLVVTDGGSFVFQGTRPVILAVYGHVAVDGVVHANANLAIPGAGGLGGTFSCGSSTGGDGSGAGGGGGGGFGSEGGHGGEGALPGSSGGSEGQVSVAGSLSSLRGGCGGGEGSSTGGSPGGGGGGLQISASGSLEISGAVAATGGGGGAGGATGGGGGGGSGGGILLEARAASFEGILSVMGGGGGSGGSGTLPGTAGENGRVWEMRPARGGAPPSSRAGAGGDSDFPGGFAEPGAPGTQITGAGGGGGGGLGYIRINVADAGCTIGATAVFLGEVSSTGPNCP